MPPPSQSSSELTPPLPTGQPLEPPHCPQSRTTTTAFPSPEEEEPDEHLSSRAHCQYHSLSLLQIDPAWQPPVPEAEPGTQGASAQAGSSLPPQPSPALPPHCLWILKRGGEGTGCAAGAFPPPEEEAEEAPALLGVHFHHHSLTLEHSLPAPQQAPLQAESSHAAPKPPRRRPFPAPQEPPLPPHWPQSGTFMAQKAGCCCGEEGEGGGGRGEGVVTGAGGGRGGGGRVVAAGALVASGVARGSVVASGTAAGVGVGVASGPSRAGSSVAGGAGWSPTTKVSLGVLHAGNAKVVAGAASWSASPATPGDRAESGDPLSGDPLPTTTTALARRGAEDEAETEAALATSASVGET